MTTEIQKPKPTALTKKTVAELLEANRGELAKALPAHLDIDRMVKLVLYSFDQNPDLLKCTQTSLFAAVKQLVELGLEPGGVRGLAYLIPYRVKGADLGRLCQLIIGYKGLILLAKRAGADTEARIVYANEHSGKDGKFKIGFGLNPVLEHEPAMFDRGAPVGAYALVRLANNKTHVEFMTWADIQRIKTRALANKSDSPWKTDEEEMARKTVVRRSMKYQELSPQMAAANEVLAAEEREVIGETIRAPNVLIAQAANALEDTPVDDREPAYNVGTGEVPQEEVRAP